MTSAEMRKLLSDLAGKHGVEFFIKKDEGNIMTVRFWVEDEDTDDTPGNS